jgi:diacylglycerol kinase family enzyme
MWFTGPTRPDVFRLFCGGFARVPILTGNVELGRARTVSLLSDGCVPLQTDGDPAGMELPVEVNVLPSAVALVVP